VGGGQKWNRARGTIPVSIMQTSCTYNIMTYIQQTECLWLVISTDELRHHLQTEWMNDWLIAVPEMILTEFVHDSKRQIFADDEQECDDDVMKPLHSALPPSEHTWL